MAPRFLVLSGPTEQLASLEQAVLRRTDLTSHLRRLDLLVMSNGTDDLLLPNERGFVFGEVFSRVDLRRAKAISTAVAENAAASGGRRFISDLWGDYVAVLIDRGGNTHIVRSPFGAMSAYRFKLGEIDMVSNDVGLLVDLGWLMPRIDWSFVAHFLAFPFRRARRTGFEGLSELPPGSALTWSAGLTPVEKGLWSPWDHVAVNPARDHAEALRDVVRRSVRAWVEGRKRLLLELSGGLDSSVLAACLWDTGVEVRCANMVSPARDGDERVFARAVAEWTGLPLEEIELSASGVDLTMPPSIRRPRPSGHALLAGWDRILSDRANADGVDAFVSGGGGDNVFFKTHTSTPAADALRYGALRTWGGAVHDLAALHDCSVWRAAGMSIKRAVSAPNQTWRSDLRFLAPAVADTALESHPWLDGSKAALPGKLEHLKLLMGAHNYLDAFPRSTAAPLLTPLLSQPIVELCLSIPSWEWIRDGRDRAVTREAFRAALPPMVVDRRTKGNLSGFAGPAFEAARGQLSEHLIGGRLDEAGLLDRAAMRAALGETGPPRGSDYFRILQLADVESWVRHWT